MKIREDFILQQVNDGYFAVAIGEASEEFNGMIKINAAGKYLWDEMQNDITEDELVSKMCARYDDLDEATARADLREFLDAIKPALEK